MLRWLQRKFTSHVAKTCFSTIQFRNFSTAGRLQGAKVRLSKAIFDPLPPDWEGVIGVEVHAQLKSARKLFSPCPAEEFELVPQENTLISPFDAALPGSLPSLQEESVHLALKMASALECEIASTISFDRKHYFYADLPSGYQISQKYAPIARNGIIRLLKDDGYLADKRDEAIVRIEQIQLEQDTAKSIHQDMHNSSNTLIDLNRAGSALIEIVSGPDMRSAEQAGAFIRKLREILRRTGVSDGNMDQGSLRCDVNISVHKIGEPWGSRCEVKNLNSIKFVMRAIGFEMHRQYQILSSGGKPIQETRSFDEDTGLTVSVRSKEDSPDYRYMPDPNLPPLEITPDMINTIQSQLPELLEQQRDRLVKQYNLPIIDVNILTRIGLELSSDIDAVAYFESVAAGRNPKVVLNWIIQILIGSLNDQGKTFADNKIQPIHFGQIVDLVESAKVTSSTARSLIQELNQSVEILEPYYETPNAPLQLLSSRGALAIGSEESLTGLCQGVIIDLAEESEKIRQGNVKIIRRLIGEVMKRSQGRANAKKAQEELMRLLKS